MSIIRSAVALSLILRGPLMLSYLMCDSECLPCYRTRNSLADRASWCYQSRRAAFATSTDVGCHPHDILKCLVPITFCQRLTFVSQGSLAPLIKPESLPYYPAAASARGGPCTDFLRTDVCMPVPDA